MKLINTNFGYIVELEDNKVFTVIEEAFADAEVENYKPSVESIYTKKAYDILNKVISCDHFMHEGYRNNQAVNLSIALHVLGYHPDIWLKKLLNHVPIEYDKQDFEIFCDHLWRVENYLYSWGPQGQEELALDFLIEE